MQLEPHYLDSVQIHLWEENQSTIALTKGKYKKAFKRWGHVACVFGGFMHVFGGEVDTNTPEATNHIFKIGLEDILNNMWSQVGSSSRGLEISGRDSLSAVQYEKRWFLLFGQCLGASTSEILQYDFVAQTVSLVTPKKTPIPREAHASVLIHNRFVVNYGGVTVAKRRNQEVDRGHKLSIWDLKENTFVDVPDAVIINAKLLKQRKCHSIVEVNNQLCVFGGSTLNSVNKTNPEDLLSDMFLVQIAFFQYVDRSVKIDDPAFVHISNDVFAKFAFARIDYQGPKVQLHSHNANVVGNDLVVYTCGEVVIKDGNRFRVVCNTRVYGYSISQNQMFEITQLRDKIPKRICSTSVGYLNALFIYGGYNNKKKSLNSISVITLNMKNKSLFSSTYAVEGKAANEMDPQELGLKRVLYSMNRKNEGVEPEYVRRLYAQNEVREEEEKEDKKR